ncbi:hypothetical protein GTY54_15180, partial [Streptomyces sp. SID625]|nr:hypothetical protein [Streptomyces sp. SID625]
EFGARPLRRTLQAELDNRIASLLLSDSADPGDTIVADVENDALVCRVERPAPSDAKVYENAENAENAEAAGDGAKARGEAGGPEAAS